MDKTCNRCGVSKPLGEFYRNHGTRDGYLNQCKTCKLEWEAERRKHPITGEAMRKRYRKFSKLPEQRWMHDEATRRQRRRYPEKYKARTAAMNAVRDGRLQRQPCEVCGSFAQAHHDDYSKPLEVRWFCFRHHKEVHANGLGH